jgi:hypothetical protein
VFQAGMNREIQVIFLMGFREPKVTIFLLPEAPEGQDQTL